MIETRSLAGHVASISLLGGSVTFSNEASSGSSIGPYKTIDEKKRAFDINKAVSVFVDGFKVSEGFSVTHSSGSVMFNEEPGGVVTMSGSYLITTKAATVREFDISIEFETHETTVLGDTHVNRIASIGNATGSITSLQITNDIYKEHLLSGEPLFAEFRPEDGAEPLSMWILLSSRALEMTVSDLQTATISFESTGKF